MIQAKADMEYLLNNLEMGEIVRKDLGASQVPAAMPPEAAASCLRAVTSAARTRTSAWAWPRIVTVTTVPTRAA